MKTNGTLEAPSAKQTKKASFPIEIGISDKNRQEVANALNKLLADEQILYAKTRNYHWNIESSNFMEMHLFYERLYTKLAETIDSIAERIRQIGHYAQGRLEDFLSQTNLLEGEYTNDQNTQLRNLLDDHETVIREVRRLVEEFEDKYKDTGSSDFVTGVLKQHEQWAWFVRSYLK